MRKRKPKEHAEWTIQRHGQHWSQDTERRKTKHKNTLQHKKKQKNMELTQQR